MRSRLSKLAVDLAALSMDEPPSASTLAASLDCLEAIAALGAEVSDIGPLDSRHQALLESMSRCLEAARARRVLFVFVVPHLVSAAELLLSPAADSTVALDGCRYELDSMVPPPAADRQAPDVPLSALSRGAKPDTRD